MTGQGADTSDADSVFDTSGLSADEAAIVDIERRMSRAQAVEEITGTWHDGAVYYDFGPGRFDDRAAATVEIRQQFTAVENLRTRVLELTVRAEGTIGYAFSRQNFIADPVGGGPTASFVFRETDVFEKHDGEWRLVHQHLSVPTDLGSGSAILESEVPEPAPE